MDVEEVGLPSPLLVEGQFVVCVISARFSWGEKFKSRRGQLQLHKFTLTFPAVKQTQMNWFRTEEPSQPPRVIRFLG